MHARSGVWARRLCAAERKFNLGQEKTQYTVNLSSCGVMAWNSPLQPRGGRHSAGFEGKGFMPHLVGMARLEPVIRKCNITNVP